MMYEIPVQALQIETYLGTWYDVVHKPNRFQSDSRLGRSSVAVYSKSPEPDDSRIQVYNYDAATGDRIWGYAKPLQPLGSGWIWGDLEVTFPWDQSRWWDPEATNFGTAIFEGLNSLLPPRRGRYCIVRFDTNPDPRKELSLVSEPSRNYAWILCRAPNPDPATLQSFLATATQVGLPELARIWATLPP